MDERSILSDLTKEASTTTFLTFSRPQAVVGASDNPGVGNRNSDSGRS